MQPGRSSRLRLRAGKPGVLEFPDVFSRADVRRAESRSTCGYEIGESLQQRVSRFRSQKEVMKADYAVAQASDPGGTGDALVRAQDKIATMQARAGALDELLQSGVLEDVGGHTDDIREELDEAAAAADVDSQLAALKAKLAASPATPELPSGDSPPASPAKE
jgi:phage shock protein A